MITTRDLDKVLSLLRRVYNIVIIDTPSSLNDAVWRSSTPVTLSCTC